ncbi:MAG: ABC transporter substrate-binding protein [Pseudomonadota bacterium]
MKRIIFTLTVVFIAAAMMAPGAVSAKDEIVIGVAAAQTGMLIPWDLPNTRMLQFYAEDVNKAGGIMGRQVKVLIADMKSDPKLGPTAALEVIQQGAMFLMCTCDYDFGSPAAFVADKRKMVVFSPCAASTKFGVQGVGPYAFTLSHGTPTEGAAIAEFGFKKGWKNVYILLDTSVDYDKKIVLYFSWRWQGLGGKILGTDTFVQGDPSIASQITRLKAVTPKPDVILLASWAQGLGSALRQIRAAGIQTPVLGDEAADGVFWIPAVPDLSNFYYVTYGSLFGDDPNTQWNELVLRYEKKYGEKPGLSNSITGYSVGQALAKAIEMSGGKTDGDSIKKALESFKDVPLLVGPTTFTEKVHMSLGRPLAVLEIQNGKHKFLGMVKAEKIPPVEEFK